MAEVDRHVDVTSVDGSRSSRWPPRTSPGVLRPPLAATAGAPPAYESIPVPAEDVAAWAADPDAPDWLRQLSEGVAAGRYGWADVLAGRVDGPPAQRLHDHLRRTATFLRQVGRSAVEGRGWEQIEPQVHRLLSGPARTLAEATVVDVSDDHGWRPQPRVRG